MTKQSRQHRIAELIEANAVGSQMQLVDLLANEGVNTTQATVSRDLEELGVIRIRLDSESIYAIADHPKDRVVPEHFLERVLGEWVVGVGLSANLVVLHTPAGAAHVVGSALDRAKLPEVVGVVAGDDTVLVVAAEKPGGPEVAKLLAGYTGVGISK